MSTSFSRDPLEQLREHVYIAPYYEDDISQLRDLIGVDRVLFGSDFPHAEGLADPTSFVDELVDFPAEEVRQIMGENARSLAQPLA